VSNFVQQYRILYGAVQQQVHCVVYYYSLLGTLPTNSRCVWQIQHQFRTMRTCAYLLQHPHHYVRCSTLILWLGSLLARSIVWSGYMHCVEIIHAIIELLTLQTCSHSHAAMRFVASSPQP
jgi:hypothetical protein